VLHGDVDGQRMEDAVRHVVEPAHDLAGQPLDTALQRT
jgi:hypothetical protein